MNKDRKITLGITLAAIVLCVLMLTGLVSREIVMPLVLLILGGLNIWNGYLFTKDGRKGQGRFSVVIGVLVLCTGIYATFMLIMK